MPLKLSPEAQNIANMRVLRRQTENLVLRGGTFRGESVQKNSKAKPSKPKLLKQSQIKKS